MEFKLKQFKREIEVSKIANIHYFEFTKQYHTFMDSHAFRELVYVDSGRISVEADGYNGILNTNHIIIHKANQTHSLSCPNDDAPNVIIIGFECKNSELDTFSSQPILLSPEQQKILTEIIREGRNVFLPPYDVPNLKNMKKRQDYPFGADQLIKIKLEELLISIVRSRSTTSKSSVEDVNDHNILKISAYINENFREKINLDELCFLYSTNKTTLCHNFKAEFGETIIEHINKLKIKEAKKLFREGSLNMTQIATSVGFSSIHYFSKTFKQYENKSPSEYIKTIKSRLD
jgi:AraC-like DNA-binding protein